VDLGPGHSDQIIVPRKALEVIDHSDDVTTPSPPLELDHEELMEQRPTEHRLGVFPEERFQGGWCGARQGSTTRRLEATTAGVESFKCGRGQLRKPCVPCT
jgi:hypothetical protein